ncbi:DUF2243 domain-containing protein [Streptomyces sp. NPDC059819]|uniref:DUF2243 domain-containing protein n=1 Tax=Streptomyces sp. NPDC059819 TaxID=3346963 RepID=UPI00365F67C2
MATPAASQRPPQPPPQPSRGRPLRARTAWSGALIGVGIAAFVDETVFHQLLHWHHFYDRSTPGVALVSDGLFHAFGWVAVVIGLVLVADLRHRAALVPRALVGGILAGTGAFQLYDGTVQHKLMGLHQIRYHVDLVPYDLTWNVLAVVFIGVGAGLLLGAARSPNSASGATS